MFGFTRRPTYSQERSWFVVWAHGYYKRWGELRKRIEWVGRHGVGRIEGGEDKGEIGPENFRIYD